MRKAKAHRQGMIFGTVLSVVVVSMLLTGGYYVDQLRSDYNTKITSLNETTQDLEQQLQDKQEQIYDLIVRISEANQRISDIAKQFDLQIGELSQRLGDLQVESESFSGVISGVIDATVSVLTNVGQGSGAIISAKGYVVTNYHVIQGARMVSIKTYGGDIYDVTLVGYDIDDDLAVLKIDSNNTFSYMNFGNSDSLSIGQKVVALGNPLGLSFTATEGIVSSPSRLASDGKYYIQTDVTLNPGNSGGPLINSLGEMVGIVDFKISGYEELGFAIPSNRVNDITDSIISSA